MRKLALVAAFLVSAQAPNQYQTGDEHLSLNPCQGITKEEIVSTFNSDGIRSGGPNGPRLAAYGASPFSSTTAGFGAGYPGICTGYLSVGLADNPNGQTEAYHYNVYRDQSGKLVLQYVRD
jgi:hypothetical protein